MTKMKALLVQIAIILGVFGTAILYWFGTGDQVKCGVGVTSTLCYLPGITWSSELFLVVGVVAFIGLLMINDTDRID